MNQNQKQHLPPSDVAPHALFLKLQERPKPSAIVDLPVHGEDGKSLGKVRIQVLSVVEQESAKFAVDAEIREKRKIGKDGITELVSETIGDMVACEILARACVGTDAINSEHVAATGARPIYPRIFATGEDVKQLAPSELMVLWGHYLLVQERFGPTERTVRTHEERDAWIRRLVEGGSMFPLARLPLPALAELTMSLAARCYSLSCILASLHSTSPDILDATLKNLGSGTTWSSNLPSSLDEIGSSPSLGETPDQAPTEKLEIVTPEMAMQAARKMRGE